MLVLSRKLNEVICVGENIKIRIVKVKGNTVRIGIEAPEEVPILRGELQFDRPDANSSSTIDSLASETKLDDESVYVLKMSAGTPTETSANPNLDTASRDILPLNCKNNSGVSEELSGGSGMHQWVKKVTSSASDHTRHPR